MTSDENIKYWLEYFDRFDADNSRYIKISGQNKITLVYINKLRTCSNFRLWR